MSAARMRSSWIWKMASPPQIKQRRATRWIPCWRVCNARVYKPDYERYLDSKLYTSSLPISHDPGNEDATGPYIQGQELNMTLRGWLAAKGTGDYTCRQGNGQIEMAFENLVPDAVYTMWNFYIPTPAAEPFSTYDLPMGKRDGSESAFFTDSSGSATYKASLEGCLQVR